MTAPREPGFYWVRIVETFGEQWMPGELKEVIDAGASRRWLYVTGAATPHTADLSDIEWGPRIEPPGSLVARRREAGDRRDWDECNRIEAEDDKPEPGDNRTEDG